MIENGNFAEWVVFYYDESKRLQAHFDAGGTIEMLNGKLYSDGIRVESALYHCCNEDALDCLPIMMSKGASPDNSAWNLALKLNRTEHVEGFLLYKFLPPKNLVLEYFDKLESVYTLKTLTRFLCHKSVIYLLCYSKTQPQPFYYLWILIAKQLWKTRFEKNWLDVLPL